MVEDRTTLSQMDGDFHTTRRGFLVGATALGGAIALPGGSFATRSGAVYLDPWIRGDGTREPVPIPETRGPRHWLGPELWGNRLQDWHVDDGRLECLLGRAEYELRTVGVLTRELVASDGPGHLRVRTGILDGTDDGGFAGFLVGVGNGELEYRAAALAQRSSGTGGGLLCTFETDGRVRFREHTDEENPVAYEERPPDDVLEPTAGADPSFESGVRLALDLLPEDGDRFSVVLKAIDPETGDLLSGAVREGVRERELLGGLSLASSPYPQQDGARWWFDELETAGPKVGVFPDRTFGPIAGTLFSVSESGLKLSAHFVPSSDADPETVRLRYRRADADEPWQTVRTSVRERTAVFRVEDWDSTQEWVYRVTYRDATGDAWTYEGRIPAEPSPPDELTIGALGCTNACMRNLDTDRPLSEYADVSIPGRYTTGNVYVPYATTTRSVRSRDPDLLVFNGDQIYEDSPTRPASRTDPDLDFHYRWLLWLWSFRTLTRDTPTIVLIDDHDVYQANLWGAGGEAVTERDNSEATTTAHTESPLDFNEGGYVASADFVNRVQRVQTGHNPDPYDATPVERGISVYYGAFTYGGTAFAMLEDRKFKTGVDVNPREQVAAPVLLGERQEDFLTEWADSDLSAPCICLTQTCFAAVSTTPEGEPFLDPDANGFPKPGRDRAIDLLREAGALVLSGDQHLATLVRHGIDGPTDGVVQFTIPAGGAAFQRWFEPAETLPNGRGLPNTGEFTDAFGNEFRMLAVANPKLSFQTVWAAQSPDKRRQTLYSREQKREGYGIVSVNYDEEAFVVECWPWDADSSAEDAEQYPGWPYRLAFDETDGRRT